jgi:hypothetical protein
VWEFGSLLQGQEVLLEKGDNAIRIVTTGEYTANAQVPLWAVADMGIGEHKIQDTS